jgi:hypothetical protein
MYGITNDSVPLHFIASSNPGTVGSFFPAQRYTRAWACPEVRGSDAAVSASFAIDLFALGLVLAVILRPHCHANTIILPSDSDITPLLTDQQALFEALDCKHHTHGPLVSRLCCLQPEGRGTIADVVSSFERNGARVLPEHEGLYAQHGEAAREMLRQSQSLSQQQAQKSKKA